MSDVKIQRITTAVDMSELSGFALQAALEMKQVYEAEMEVVMAYSPDAPLQFTTAQVTDLAEQAERNRQALEQELHQWVSRYTLQHSIPARVILGNPVSVITQAASESDLIVLGTHGKSGISLFRLGSVSEAVIRDAAIPVLAVHQTGHDRTFPPKYILCPFNFTPVAQKSLDFAFSFASRFGSHLTIMAAEEHGESLSEQLHSHCELMNRKREGTACHLNVVIRQGEAAEEIMKVAQEVCSDLIVIGARRKESFTEALFGSTTEKILRHAHTSLLVVPEKPTDNS